MTLPPSNAVDQPAVVPASAAGWLSAWRVLGGGVTIGVDNQPVPWRIAPVPDDHADRAERLFAEFHNTPGLPVAVRRIIRAAARRKARS